MFILGGGGGVDRGSFPMNFSNFFISSLLKYLPMQKKRNFVLIHFMYLKVPVGNEEMVTVNAIISILAMNVIIHTISGKRPVHSSVG